VSFSELREIFAGRWGTNYCVKTILCMKSPKTCKKYLTKINSLTSISEKYKLMKWSKYQLPKGTPQINPIRDADLLNSGFVSKIANKLSFDISRFTDFLLGYNKVDDDIKPVMLHYGLIYLLDFFSRTWLKYASNAGHGIKIVPSEHSSSALETETKIGVNGIFPRAVDAFYLINESSLFSNDDSSGIGYQLSAITGEPISKVIDKTKYSESPKLTLSQLLDIYEQLAQINGSVTVANKILVGYTVVFTLSSISRYRAESWYEINANRDLKNRIDLVQYDFLSEWIPELLGKTIIRKELRDIFPFKSMD
jgi:hypothetical protein